MQTTRVGYISKRRRHYSLPVTLLSCTGLCSRYKRQTLASSPTWYCFTAIPAQTQPSICRCICKQSCKTMYTTPNLDPLKNVFPLPLMHGDRVNSRMLLLPSRPSMPRHSVHCLFQNNVALPNNHLTNSVLKTKQCVFITYQLLRRQGPPKAFIVPTLHAPDNVCPTPVEVTRLDQRKQTKNTPWQ